MAGRRQEGQGRGRGRPEDSAIRTAERLLIESFSKLGGRNVLCALSPECQTAAAFAEQFPGSQLTCHFLDQNAAEFARSTQLVGFNNAEAVAGPDLPAGPFDLFLLPFPAHGELELARDLLEQGIAAVRLGGTLAVAADSNSEGHLRTEMKKLFGRPAAHSTEDGVVFLATKSEELRKPRDFRHEFAFRDQGRLLSAVSRPGLQSHRRMVGGLRPLLDAMEIRPGDRVLNLGCDAGVLALAAAGRAEGIQVVAVDSNTRAVSCTKEGAAKNGLSNVETHVASGRWSEGRGAFDLVLACPPYIANSRVADTYVDGAYEALKPGGRLAYSSKHRVWYVDELSRGFERINVQEVREHNVITATKRSR